MAQFNVESADGDRVTIGPGGITVNKRGTGQTVDINQGGIKINGTGARRSSNTRVEVRGSKKPLTTRRTVTTSTKKSGQVVVERPIEEQVASIEVQVYGNKISGQPLLVRIEKLEMDSLGQKGTGTLKQRVVALSAAVGGSQPHAVSRTSNVRVTETTRTADSTNNISSDSITVSPGNVSIKSQATGADYVLNDAMYNGTVRCDNNNATINASMCNIHFVGTLNRLTVNGSNNKIDCDSVSQIALNGAENNVTWKASPRKPAISNVGAGNVLGERR